MDGITTDQMAVTDITRDFTTMITSEILVSGFTTDTSSEFYSTIIMDSSDGSIMDTGSILESNDGFMNTGNITGSDNGYFSYIPLAEKIIESILLSIIWILAFWGNLLLWVVVFQKRSLRTITNAMVLCLSAADLLVSITNLPFTIFTVIVGEWIFGDIVCVVLGFMNMLTFVTSVMSLAAIGICRYLFICHPDRFRRVYTHRNTGWIIAGVWIFSGLLACPPLLGWGIYDYLPRQSFCFCKWTTSVSYTFFMVGVCFGGPCSVMSFCYIQILRVVRTSRKRVDSTMRRQSSTVDNKVHMPPPPPPELKVPQTTSGDNSTNDTLENRGRCSSFTLSITSNSGGSSGHSGQTDVTTLSAQTPEMQTQGMNSLQIPSTSSKARMSNSDEKNQSISNDENITTESFENKNLSNRPPQVITNEMSPSTNGEVKETVHLRPKPKKRESTISIKTGTKLHSPPIEEDRPSFLNRLSQHGSVVRSMVTRRGDKKRASENERSRRRRQEELKLTKSFIVVIFCFIICWMPFCVAMFWSVFGKNPPPRIFDMGTLILGYFNSCCNPIIYGVMNNKFRAGYKAIIFNTFNLCRRNKNRHSLNSSVQDNEGSLTNKRYSQSQAAGHVDRSY